MGGRNVTVGEEWADGMSQWGRSGRTECHSGGGVGGRNVTVGEERADGMSQWGRSGRTECHSGEERADGMCRASESDHARSSAAVRSGLLYLIPASTTGHRRPCRSQVSGDTDS